MIEGEKSIVKTPCITKEAKTINSIGMNNVIQGIKAVLMLERQAKEAEIGISKKRKNQEEKENYIPTGDEVSRDLKNGEYREIID